MTEPKAGRRLPRVDVQERIADHASKKLQINKTNVRAGVAMYGVGDRG